MLVEKLNYEIGNIVAVKLVNGDEVVAKYLGQDNDVYVLDKPCVVVGGPKGIGLMQAMFSLDPEKSIQVKASHVIMTCEAVKQMKEHYIEVTTGIKTVSKGPIVV